MCDETYSDLITMFAERAHQAQALLEDVVDDYIDLLEDSTPTFSYIFITGIRSDGELMYAIEEQALYVSNGKITAKINAEAFTCYIEKCTGRVYLKPDGIAYQVGQHNVNHGSMYSFYKELQCRSFMREECLIAGASKKIKDIYDDAVIL